LCALHRPLFNLFECNLLSLLSCWIHLQLRLVQLLLRFWPVPENSQRKILLSRLRCNVCHLRVLLGLLFELSW
jgi:hypothetical protein